MRLPSEFRIPVVAQAFLIVVLLIIVREYSTSLRASLEILLEILSQNVPVVIGAVIALNSTGWLFFHQGYTGKVDKAKKEEMQAANDLLRKAYESHIAINAKPDFESQIEQVKGHCKEFLVLESKLQNVKDSFFWGMVVSVLGLVTELFKGLGGLDFVALIVSLYFFFVAVAVGNRFMDRLSKRVS